MKKLLLVSNRNVHYRQDIYRLLAIHFDCTFVFIADKISSHKKLIDAKRSLIDVPTFFLKRGELFRLRRLVAKKDVVINVGLNEVSVLLALMKTREGFLLYNWWGGTEESERKISLTKKMFRRAIIARYDGAFVYSVLAKNYLISTGLPDERAFVLGNNTFKPREVPSDEPKSIDIINVAFHDVRKNTRVLVRALLLLKENFGVCPTCTIVGKGPELHRLQEFSKSRDLAIDFVGAKNPDEVQILLAKSRLFVHCAILDQWPQTYNEAQMSGIPCILSDKSGIHDFYTGANRDIVSYSCNDELQLAKLINTILFDSQVMSKLVKDTKSNVSMYNCNTAFDVINRVLNGTSPNLTSS